MYCDYFGFKERPFTIAPNPKYLFMSERHREALAHLVFGVGESGGFVLLTGEVGTGKTTVCRCLLEQLPENTDIAFILNPKLSSMELLQTICDDLQLNYGLGSSINKSGVSEKISIKLITDALNRHLLKSHAAGRHTVLLIDEAQNLSPEVLEQIRLLTNLETNEKKLLQIILIGQPELKTILSKNELRQLSQRITARYHLDPLTRGETSGYISYRMAVAGSEAKIFNASSIETIHRISQGVPRLINTICDRSLLGAYSRNQKNIDTALVKQAAVEVLGEKGAATTGISHKEDKREQLAIIKKLALGLMLLVVGVILGLWLPGYFSEAKSDKQLVTVTEQAVSEVAQNSLLRVSVLPEITSTFDEALLNLASIWDVKLIEGCTELRNSGLFCSEHQGSWGQFLSLNRPAILTIINNGERQFIAVNKADGVNAEVSTKQGAVTIPIIEIQPLWNGEYTLLWKQPANYTKPIQSGDSGKQVQWLEKKLFNLMFSDNEDEVIIPATIKFDNAFKLQLIEFQKEHGLRADGVAGQQTIMMINQLLDTAIPLLSSVNQKGDDENVSNP